MLLVTERFTPPPFDTAISAAILESVAAGADPMLRIWVPDRSVAFGRQDRVRAGYRSAVTTVTALGYAPTERLAGGRAATFHEATVAFSWALATTRPRETIETRFRMIGEIVLAALRGLGADARIGEVPGEYCPGAWSVNLGGTRKVMGVGQRLVRGAAHLGGVIVVDRPDLVNAPLLPAYQALGYAWNPEATGAMAAAVPGITTAAVGDAFVAAAADAGHPSDPATLPPAIVTRARALAPDHDPSR